jgi:hypothetical protein
VPSHSAQNRGGQKKVRSPRILLVSKTDNPYVSTTSLPQHTPRVSLQKPISLAQPRNAYPYFLACKPEIETLLRAGHTMHRVWEAYRQASPPFPATYETFRTYCVKLGLSKLRNGPISAPPEAAHVAVPPPSSSPPSANARPSPKVWPRIPGKPREFIPRSEDD